MNKRMMALLTAGVMAASLFSVGVYAEEETIKIGVFQPLSGGNAAYGQEARNGVELGVNYVNENGGFAGMKGELVIYDTQCSVEEAVKVASKLVNEDKVDVVLGSLMSSEMFAAGATLNDAGVYTLGFGTSASWMKEDWPYVFRPTMNNGASAPSTAQMILDMGYDSVGIFYGQDDAALSTYQEFKKACEAIGVEVKAEESYDQGDTDFSAQITNILLSDADCVYISVIGETAPPLVKQLRQFGYDGLILDKESFMFSQVSIAGIENSDYVAFVNPYVTYESIDDITVPQVKEFAQRYADAYGDINKTDSAYRGWDAVLVLQKACEIAGSKDSDALRDATNTISGLQALGGVMDFTHGDREAYHEYNSWILVGGKNLLWADWLQDGVEAFREATGR